jgi:multiple sugar transport system substrate-binding protein
MAHPDAIDAILSRRALLKAAALGGGAIIGSSVLAACGVGATAAPSAAAPTAPAGGPTIAPAASLGGSPAAAKPATLNLLYATVEADVDAIKLVLPDFEKQFGIKINLDSQPYNALQQKVFAELAQGSSFYDITVVDTPWMPALTKQIEPLSSYIQNTTLTDTKLLAIDDFIPKVFYDTAVYEADKSYLEFPGTPTTVDAAAITAAGFDVFGLPLQANVLTMSYRKDLFNDTKEQSDFQAKYGKALGVPQTWDDFVQVAQFFTRPAKRLYGTTLMPGTGDWATDDFKSLLAAYGGYGKMVDDQFKRRFNGPEGVAALTFYADLINKYKVTPPGVTSFSWDEASAAFVSGLTAMSMNYHSEKLSSTLQGEVAYAVVPKKVSVGPHFGTWMLSVNKFSKNKEWAYQAIVWLTAAAQQTKMLATQLHPSRKSVYDAAKTDPNATQFGNFYDILGQSLAVGIGRPRLTNYGDVDNMIYTAVNNVATGAATPQDALTKADGLVLDALKKAGYPAT